MVGFGRAGPVTVYVGMEMEEGKRRRSEEEGEDRREKAGRERMHTHVREKQDIGRKNRNRVGQGEVR